MKKIILILCFMCLAYFLFSPSDGDGIIRLRVIAASDSAYDQSEKMRVVRALDSMLDRQSFSSVDDAENWINDNRDAVCRVCEDTLGNADFDVEFRRESYSDGVYKSLVVTLGKGEGHNFWGTLFPDISYRASSSSGDGKSFGILCINGNLVEARFWIIDKLLKIF